jgi:hypothetical protein
MQTLSRSTHAMVPFNHNQLHAVELNNLGVLCLERRHFSHGHSLFREALRCTVGAAATIQGYSQEQEPRRSERNGACETDYRVCQGEAGSGVIGVATGAHHPHAAATLHVPSTLLLPLPAAAAAAAAAAPASTLQQEGSNDLASAFHSQGLTIDAACLQWLSESPLDDGITLCSAIVTFNVALVYHSTAVQGYKGSSQLLDKARILYQKCLQFLTWHGPVTRPANSTIDLLHMAVLTNLAHVHFEQLDFTLSCDYQCHLARYVSSLGPLSLRYPDTRMAQFMELQTGNYLLNMFYSLQPPMVAQAA